MWHERGTHMYGSRRNICLVWEGNTQLGCERKYVCLKRNIHFGSVRN